MFSTPALRYRETAVMGSSAGPSGLNRGFRGHVVGALKLRDDDAPVGAVPCRRWDQPATWPEAVIGPHPPSDQRLVGQKLEPKLRRPSRVRTKHNHPA